MKKIISLIICVFILINTTSISYAYNLNKIYEKIDVVYSKSPNKLISLNNKINKLINWKYKWTKIEYILIELNSYIDYKLKNKNFYKWKISKNIINKFISININSYTDQERLIKFNQLLLNNELSFLEKEYIKYWILNSEVSIYLNHQNFTKAKEITINYFKSWSKLDNNKFEFLAKNLDYNSFSLLTQLIAWINPDKKSTIIDYRSNFFPDEKNTAYNLVRKLWYNWINCEDLTIKDENIDLIDKKFCKIINWKFEKKDIDDVEKLNNRLQNLSDKANYYTYVWRIDWYRDIMEEKKKWIWKKILKYDPNFVNAYLILLSYFDYKNDCYNFNNYFIKWKENYNWDNDKKINIFNKRKFKNCAE